MATDQACYALIAYDRFLKGQTALYDMSDGLDATFIGGQTKEYTEDNTDYYAVRFLATIDAKALYSKSIKFKITASCTKDGSAYAVSHWENQSTKTYEIDVTEAYTSVDVAGASVAANQLDGAKAGDDYICAVALKKISKDALKNVNITFTVEIVVETAFGTELKSEAQSITICNGVSVQ